MTIASNEDSNIEQPEQNNDNSVEIIENEEETMNSKKRKTEEISVKEVPTEVVSTSIKSSTKKRKKLRS